MPANAGGYRYPNQSDSPDVPRDIKNLADDVYSYAASIGHTHAYAAASHTHAPGDMSTWTWTAYTPAVVDAANNNVISLGTGTTSVGRYVKLGKVCHVAGTLILGSGGLVGTTSGQRISMRLPFTTSAVGGISWSFAAQIKYQGYYFPSVAVAFSNSSWFNQGFHWHYGNLNQPT